ncbi:MAG: hypothetical protein LUH19_01465 [Lachnospiraceae bacterium]|nr:hypothetical protein [Lachnospiraceae bacterium]
MNGMKSKNVKKQGINKKTAGKMVPKAQAEPQEEIEEYLYMLPVDVTVQDLKPVIQADEEKKDLWKELDLMEVKLSHDSLIFENFMDCFDSASDQTFLKENGVKKVYAFSYQAQDRSAVAQALKDIHAVFGGFIASDTEDLKPIYQPEDF